MSGDEKTLVVGLIAAALSFMAFVAGCTVTLRADAPTKQMKACLEARLEWRNGNCTKGGAE